MTRSVKIGPGRLRTVNCRLFWTRTIPNRKKCLPSNWVFLQVAISMRLLAMGKVQKIGKWMPHELNDRQMERCQNTCQILLARQKRKSFLYRIVTGDEKKIYFQNSKCKKSWVDPTINIFLKIKSLWTEDDAVRLMGSGGCHLLRC